MAKYSVPTSVADVAKVFDIESPGWEKKIKPDSLNISTCMNCPMGQVFGNYLANLELKWFGTYTTFLSDNKHKQEWIDEVNKRLENKTVTFGEALQAAVFDGARIVPVDHDESNYIYLSPFDGLVWKNDGCKVHFHFNQKFKDGWKILPKKILILNLKEGQKFKLKNRDTVFTRTSEFNRQLYDDCKLEVISEYTEVEKVL